METLSLKEFMNYKQFNRTMPPQLKQFIVTTRKPRYRSTFRKGATSTWTRPDINNSWINQKKAGQTEVEKFEAEIRGNLNKINDSNFDDIMGIVIELLNYSSVSEKEIVKILVEQIFMKAVNDSVRSGTYAQLIIKLLKKYKYFKEELIKTCHAMFEEAVSIDNDAEKKGIFKYKETVCGCMNFIGELYNCNILTKQRIYICFQRLFLSFDLNKAYTVDNLCKLMSVVGKKFFIESEKEARECFSKIKGLEEHVQMKEKCAIWDLIDEKKDNKWI